MSKVHRDRSVPRRSPGDPEGAAPRDAAAHRNDGDAPARIELPQVEVNWANEVTAYSVMSASLALTLWAKGECTSWTRPLLIVSLVVAVVASFVSRFVGKAPIDDAEPATSVGSDVPGAPTSWQSPDGRWWPSSTSPGDDEDGAWQTPQGDVFERRQRPFFLQPRARGDAWVLIVHVLEVWLLGVILALFVLSVAGVPQGEIFPSGGALFAALIIAIGAFIASLLVVARWLDRLASRPGHHGARHPWPGVGSAAGGRWHQRGAWVTPLRQVATIVWAVGLIACIVLG